MKKTKGKWLTNIQMVREGMILAPDEKRFRDSFLPGKIIDAPKATEKYTANELGNMGMVGIYEAKEIDCLQEVDISGFQE